MCLSFICVLIFHLIWFLSSLVLPSCQCDVHFLCPHCPILFADLVLLLFLFSLLSLVSVVVLILSLFVSSHLPLHQLSILSSFIIISFTSVLPQDGVLEHLVASLVLISSFGIVFRLLSFVRCVENISFKSSHFNLFAVLAL